MSWVREIKTLVCDGWCGGKGDVTHIDMKGFIYCRPCGETRKRAHRCRKLQPFELRHLREAGEIPTYSLETNRRILASKDLS